MKNARAIRGPRAFFLALAIVVILCPAPSLADDLRLISYNITAVYDLGRDGTQYQTNIVKGLEPDVALLQEWKLDSDSPWGADYGAWVEEAFGEEFEWYRGPGALVPNGGIVSRWPLKSSGSWNDQTVDSRTFDWAVINIPGDVDLQVVSVHLKAGDDAESKAKRIDEANQIKAYVAANFDPAQYIVVAGDFNTQSYGSEPDLIDIFNSFLQVEAEDCQPADRNDNVFTNVNRSNKYDWIMPNAVIGDASMLFLGVSEYQYPCGNVFDSRIFPNVETELPPINYDDTDHSSYADHCPVVKAFNILPAGGGIYVLKADKGFDDNLYLYKSLSTGDTTYWDAVTRNPSPIARDLWVIPAGNNAIAMTIVSMKDKDGRDLKALAVMKNEGGDYNLYLYNSILSGDWTYWDALSRNPSPIARDFWIIPSGNNASILARTDVNSDRIDEFAVIKNTWGKQTLFIYNTPMAGDWTYTDAFLRNWNPEITELYVAMDDWYVPRTSNVVALAGMRAVDGGVDPDTGKTIWTEGLVTVESSSGDQNLYVWKTLTAGINTQMENLYLQQGTDPATGKPWLGYPQGQDLWIVTQRNDIQDLTGIAAESLSGENVDAYDVIGTLGNASGDNNFWFWKTVQIGDVTYNNALLRQDGYPRPISEDIPNYGKPQARDFWMLPTGNNVKDFSAIPSTAPLPTPTPTDRADFSWDPINPDPGQETKFTDLSATSNPPLVSWFWTFEDGDPATSSDQNPVCNFDLDDPPEWDKSVSLTVTDSAANTFSTTKTVTLGGAP